MSLGLTVSHYSPHPSHCSPSNFTFFCEHGVGHHLSPRKSQARNTTSFTVSDGMFGLAMILFVGQHCCSLVPLKVLLFLMPQPFSTQFVLLCSVKGCAQPALGYPFAGMSPSLDPSTILSVGESTSSSSPIPSQSMHPTCPSSPTCMITDRPFFLFACVCSCIQVGVHVHKCFLVCSWFVCVCVCMCVCG
jgi:hypothetical protein